MSPPVQIQISRSDGSTLAVAGELALVIVVSQQDAGIDVQRVALGSADWAMLGAASEALQELRRVLSQLVADAPGEPTPFSRN